MKTINSQRRKFLSFSAIGAMGLLSQHVLAKQVCALTPEQTEGPFYPITDQPDKNNDLTVLLNSTQTAEGRIVVVQGVVRNTDCEPVQGVLVEIWQACHSGRYNHPSDPNTAPLDPNFQYWGECITNEKGEYSFKTIQPGSYPATDSWTRPPHIHFKATKRGFHELTTQMYFLGEKYNDTDRILQDLTKEEQDQVVIDMQTQTSEWGVLPTGQFDLTLRSVR